jgi:hypothetical protein
MISSHVSTVAACPIHLIGGKKVPVIRHQVHKRDGVKMMLLQIRHLRLEFAWRDR